MSKQKFNFSLNIHNKFGESHVLDSIDPSKNINWVIRHIKTGENPKNRTKVARFLGSFIGLEKQKKRLTNEFIEKEASKVELQKKMEEGLKVMGMHQSEKRNVIERASKLITRDVVDQIKVFAPEGNEQEQSLASKFGLQAHKSTDSFLNNEKSLPNTSLLSPTRETLHKSVSFRSTGKFKRPSIFGNRKLNLQQKNAHVLSVNKSQMIEDTFLEKATSENSELIKRLMKSQGDGAFMRVRKQAGTIYHNNKVINDTWKADVSSVPFSSDIFLHRAVKTQSMLMHAKSTTSKLDKIETRFNKLAETTAKKAEELLKKNPRIYKSTSISSKKPLPASLRIKKKKEPRASPSLPVSPSAAPRVGSDFPHYLAFLSSQYSTASDHAFVATLRRSFSSLRGGAAHRSKALSLGSLFRKYFTKPQDEEVMKVASKAYQMSTYWKRKKIVMSTLASRNEAKGELWAGQHHREVVYASCDIWENSKNGHKIKSRSTSKKIS